MIKANREQVYDGEAIMDHGWRANDRRRAGPQADGRAGVSWKRGEMCESCAGRKDTDANLTPGTVESTAVRDPDGLSTDRHGNRYRKLPLNRWRLVPRMDECASRLPQAAGGDVSALDRWENFEAAIARGEKACEVSGQPVKDHFREVTKMVPIRHAQPRTHCR